MIIDQENPTRVQLHVVERIADTVEGYRPVLHAH
jgi:hypothetical protein